MAALAAFWVLLMPEPGWGDLVVGIAAALLARRAAAALPLAGPLGRAVPGAPEGGAAPAGSSFARVRAALLIGGASARDVLVGSRDMVRIVLGIDARPPAGLVEVPAPDLSPPDAAEVGLLVTLSPGSVLVDADREDGLMVYHVLGREAGEFRRRVEDAYLRPRPGARPRHTGG